MQVALPELDAPAILNLNREVSAADFEEFCAANPSLRAELTANGEISIMPPAGGESSFRSADVCMRLGAWALTTQRGKVFDSSAAFVLPSGAILSPDTAWVAAEKLQTLTPAQRRRFLRLTPDFIVEVVSPTDRQADTEKKMLEWIANGVALAWLINGDTRTVTIYRPNQPPETQQDVLSVSGEGPVAGFTLDLADIWAGL
jgi:Uma2 family endonuclease